MREPREHRGDLALGHGIAHAFWLRAPGCGEIRPVVSAEPGPDDVVVRTMRSGMSRGTETLVFRGGVPPDQRAKMRRRFTGRRLPGPVITGYLNVGVLEEGPPPSAAAPYYVPAPTAYVGLPAGAGDFLGQRHRPAPRSARGSRRPAPSTRCGTAPRSSATRSRSSAQGWSAVRRTTAPSVSSRAQVTLWMSIPAALDRRGRRRLRPPGRRRQQRPGRGTECDVGCSAPSTCSPRSRFIDLSWYGDGRFGSRWEGRSAIPSRPRHPLEPGRHRPGSCRASHDQQPPGARPRSAVRSRLEGQVALRRAARGDGPTDRGSLPALCHTITYGEG